MTLATFSFLFIGVLLNACAQLLLKAGVTPLGEITLSSSTLLSTATKLMQQWPIWGGLSCYALSVIVWIIGLSRIEVSVAYPMLSLGYVVNAVMAWYLFDETLSPQRLLAIGVILIGVYLLARS